MTSTIPYLTTDTDPGQPSDTAADHNGERTRPASGSAGPARSAEPALAGCFVFAAGSQASVMNTLRNRAGSSSS